MKTTDYPENIDNKEEIDTNNNSIKTKITKQQFFFEISLYKEINISNIEGGFRSGTVEGYNSIKEKETVFDIEHQPLFMTKSNGYSRDVKYHIDNFYIIELQCKITSIKFIFLVKEENNHITKMGQYPSLADIHLSELNKKYQKVLESSYISDFKNAIRLNANGIGTGAMVYLRRVFEKIIFDIYQKNIDKLNIKTEEFSIMSMERKIETLNAFLPKSLLQFKPIYKILSKGVHELSEEDCKKYFPALKLSTQIILKEEIKIKEEETEEDEVKKEISKIQKLLNTNTKN